MTNCDPSRMDACHSHARPKGLFVVRRKAREGEIYLVLRRTPLPAYGGRGRPLLATDPPVKLLCERIICLAFCATIPASHSHDNLEPISADRVYFLQRRAGPSASPAVTHGSWGPVGPLGLSSKPAVVGCRAPPALFFSVAPWLCASVHVPGRAMAGSGGGGGGACARRVSWRRCASGWPSHPSNSQRARRHGCPDSGTRGRFLNCAVTTPPSVRRIWHRLPRPAVPKNMAGRELRLAIAAVGERDLSYRASSKRLREPVSSTHKRLQGPQSHAYGQQS